MFALFLYTGTWYSNFQVIDTCRGEHSNLCCSFWTYIYIQLVLSESLKFRLASEISIFPSERERETHSCNGALREREPARGAPRAQQFLRPCRRGVPQVFSPFRLVHVFDTQQSLKSIIYCSKGLGKKYVNS